jgi:hypothetical protein
MELRHPPYNSRFHQLLESPHHAYQQRAVANRQHDVLDLIVEHFYKFVADSLHAFQEVRAQTVGHVDQPALRDKRFGSVGSGLPRAFDPVQGRTEHLDLVELPAGGAIGRKYVWLEPSRRRVGRERRPGVAGRIFDELGDPQIATHRGEHCRPSVLERPCRCHELQLGPQRFETQLFSCSVQRNGRCIALAKTVHQCRVVHRESRL